MVNKKNLKKEEIDKILLRSYNNIYVKKFFEACKLNNLSVIKKLL